MSILFIQITLAAGTIVVLICLAFIAAIMIKHLQRKREHVRRLEVENIDIKLIEERLPDIQLSNSGLDIDHMIGYIQGDSDIEFSMIWSEDNG